MEEVLSFEDKRNSLPGFTFDDSEVAAFKATTEMDSDESIDGDERRFSS